eukprot:bmy_22154T0
MAEAPAQRDVPRSIVTFEDVCIHFTKEEWDLLDEDQKFLYCEVMLENFMLVISLGLAVSRYHIIQARERAQAPAKAEVIQERPGPSCSHSVEDRDAYSEQGVPIRISNAGPSMQKSHTCDMCDPILKGILHLAGRQGTSPGQQPYPCKSCGRAFWFSDLDGILRQQSGETFPRMEKGPASSVKSCRCHIRTVLAERARKTSWAALDLASTMPLTFERRHTGVLSVRRPSTLDKGITSSVKVGKLVATKRNILILHQGLHTGARPYAFSKCGRAYRRSSHLAWHMKVHTEERPHEFRLAPEPSHWREALREQGTCFLLAQHSMTHKREKL